MNMGMGEWIFVLVIVLLLFGPKRLPSLAQSIGKSVRELKNGLSGLTEDLKEPLQSLREPETFPAPKPHPAAHLEAQAEPVHEEDATPFVEQDAPPPDPAPAQTDGAETEPKNPQPHSAV